jgi:GDP/UDP-N,N'-diacetylbacillosamine 2-epimerase (hydrolysing)|tara:strand:- start:2711 stop:3850 length:1140 start_codon:yes stop_codon:yes gene_type:complete
MKYKICFAITSRADFSLAYPVIKEFKKIKLFKTLVITSGYLSGNKYGKKIDLVKKKLKKIDLEIKNYPSKDTRYEITNALANGVLKFSKYFDKFRPDYLFVFADKFEMLAPVMGSIQFKIPICHIEGGDLTEGAIDDNIRHAITKLSHLHFASTKTYKKRLIQLGEEPSRILVSGSPSLDLIKNFKFKTKIDLTKKYKLDFNKKFILCTFHPVTNEIQNTKKYIVNLINCLKKQKTSIIFTSPNADLSSQVIVKEIKNFSKETKNVRYLEKLNYSDYLSLMKNCTFMIGNSSSGIIESATIKAKVINIGTRQKGRLVPQNVISCGYSQKEINRSIFKIQNLKTKFFNPYYKKDSAKKICNFFISKINKNLANKKFKDIQ